ncbi:uncharacterized protein K02A2.6-like [Anastrepha ludens]|uniref:uncharacterized protein K02A2.6-like n=1 Tax=Anastrepha ludens TaxID=28586 RepID=UPI0023AEC475|nr:uncharacterized protein K02A2.6-like [Anastrepha ludens]
MTTEMRPFLCDSIDKSLLRSGPHLQEVIFNTPGTLVEADAENKVDVFKVLVEKLNNYFTPKRNSTFERHLFRSIAPLEGEPFNKFVLRLRHQSSKCCFGETKSEIEDIALKDKIIDSWASVDLRKRLLEKEQSLNEIIETCQINEQIQKQSQSMISKQDSEVVNKVYSTMQKGRRGGGECSRCGQLGHVSFDTNCPAKKSKCNKCGLAGHYARKCKTKGLKRKHEEAGSGTSKQRKFQPSKVRCIGKLEDDFSDNSGEYDCLQVETSTLMNEFIKCNIGGHEVTMIIDSSSRFNLLSQQAWDELESSKAIRWNIRTETVNQFKAYAANQLLKVLYVFEAPVGVRKQSEKIATFYVIKDGKQSLLGRDTGIQLKVLQLGLGVNNVEMMKAFPKISNVKIKLSLDPAIKPVKQPVRRIPIALERKVEDKLNEALAKDIIEPVTGPCGWVSPIVAVFKEGGEIRLCVDMRRANQAVLRENYPLPTFDSIMTKLKEAKFFSRLDLKWAYHQLELEESSREITTFITHKGLFRTTGTAPTELMYNRVIRDKIPGIHDITDDMLDSAARDLDIMNKQKGKEKGDMARKAKPSDIAPGDKVLLRNVVFSHKLTPTFDPTEYEVLDRDGNEVTVMGNGK